MNLSFKESVYATEEQVNTEYNIIYMSNCVCVCVCVFPKVAHGLLQLASTPLFLFVVLVISIVVFVCVCVCVCVCVRECVLWLLWILHVAPEVSVPLLPSLVVTQSVFTQAYTTVEVQFETVFFFLCDCICMCVCVHK